MQVKGRKPVGRHSGTGAGAPTAGRQLKNPAAFRVTHEGLAEASNATAATYAALDSATEAPMARERTAKLPSHSTYELPTMHQGVTSADAGPLQFCTVLDSMDMDAPSDSEEHALTRGYEAGAWLRG
jgi:hypothetical protein